MPWQTYRSRAYHMPLRASAQLGSINLDPAQGVSQLRRRVGHAHLNFTPAAATKVLCNKRAECCFVSYFHAHQILLVSTCHSRLSNGTVLSRYTAIRLTPQDPNGLPCLGRETVPGRLGAIAAFISVALGLTSLSSHNRHLVKIHCSASPSNALTKTMCSHTVCCMNLVHVQNVDGKGVAVDVALEARGSRRGDLERPHSARREALRVHPH